MNPRLWSESHVKHWLHWAANEFSLSQHSSTVHDISQMKGKDIIALGREAFLSHTPAYMGDILWEHLEILQKDQLSKALFYIVVAFKAKV
ncbi:ETS-like protein pointed, isoform P2/D [Orchesella cincta]|uniref:ETS-like protein pointed, isoform P2/D n=1 Tax=Orchesella cincta TaxID=48709 RepID=A0A1D2NG93_ORCCI|nr:ETS-like protein pointed, isoform P2/D [Orchesella cincta]